MPSSPNVTTRLDRAQSPSYLNLRSSAFRREDQTSKTPAQRSHEIEDAQKAFRCVVKKELDLLLQQGWRREEAVRALLGRIVENADEPRDEEITGVMTQFRMNKEDATRALIVKQELGRLKRRGLNPLAAIEELTGKMQGMFPVSPTNIRRDYDKKRDNTQVKQTFVVENDHDIHSHEEEFADVHEEDEEGPHASCSVEIPLSNGGTAAVFDAVASIRTPVSISQSKLEIARHPSATLPHSKATSTTPLVAAELIQSTLKRRLHTEDDDNDSIRWENRLKKLRTAPAEKDIPHKELHRNKPKRSLADIHQDNRFPEVLKKRKV